MMEKEMATHSSILPGESCGQRSLVGYSPWGHKESDMTERTAHKIMIDYDSVLVGASLVAQLVMNLPAMQETRV